MVENISEHGLYLDILSFKHLKEDHDMKHLQCEYYIQ